MFKQTCVLYRMHFACLDIKNGIFSSFVVVVLVVGGGGGCCHIYIVWIRFLRMKSSKCKSICENHYIVAFVLIFCIAEWQNRF